MNSIMLAVHIGGGSVAILAGFSTLIPRKGSKWHVLLGIAFFYSMVAMAGAGTYLAMFSSFETINALIGLFTLYLVLTARWTAANHSGQVTVREKIGGVLSGSLLVAFAIASWKAAKSGEAVVDGIYVEAFYVYTVLAAIAVALDIKVLAKGGVYGKQRVARHLWRTILALFIACGSLFLGQPQVFPESIQDSGALSAPVLLVVLALLYWLIRVYIGRRFSTKHN